MSDLIDGTGLPFFDVRKLLPERVSDWPKPDMPNESISMALFHFDHGRCWLCDALDGPAMQDTLQLHHIFGGYNRRRVNARFNYAMLCRHCHENVAGNLPAVLYAKFVHDHEYCDWLKLTLLRRSWLPQPEPLVEKAKRRA